jgi:hypothetical protein
MVETNRDKFYKKYNLDKSKGTSLDKVSELTGIKRSILDEVMKRGRGAHKNNPQSVRSLSGKKIGGSSLKGKMSANQWAMARIYSFIMKGKTWYTADKDLAEKVKKSKK